MANALARDFRWIIERAGVVVVAAVLQVQHLGGFQSESARPNARPTVCASDAGASRRDTIQKASLLSGAKNHSSATPSACLPQTRLYQTDSARLGSAQLSLDKPSLAQLSSA